MKILIVCTHGKNRSEYLKQYLATKGYDCETIGIKDDLATIQSKLSDVDVVISVHPEVEDVLKKSCDLSGKKFISLDVDDRPEHVLPEGKPLSGDDWLAFQNQYVYPKLREQIDQHLPLRTYAKQDE